MKFVTRGTLYNQIQTKPFSVSEKEVATLFDRARLDPRLMEVLTEFIRDFWWAIDPIILNKYCRKSKYPFVVRVALSCILDHCKMQTADKTIFIDWLQKAIQGLKEPNPQLFYLGIYPMGSKSETREFKEANSSFKKHNLFAKDLPFNKNNPGELKSERHLPPNRVSELDFLKFKFSKKIKNMKSIFKLSNEQIMIQTGINRVFLSYILNNKSDKISSEYLDKHTASL